LAEYNNDILKDKGLSEQYMSSYITSIGGSYSLFPNIELVADFTDEDKRSDYPTWKSTYENRSISSKVKIKSDALKVAFGVDTFDGSRKQTGNMTSKENKGIFTTASYLAGDTIISAGGRYEEVNYKYTPDTGASLEKKEHLNGWDIGVNQTLNKNQSIFANYNKAFQAPDVDRFFNYGGTFNDFINPAISKTLTIGFNDFRSSNKLKLTLFRTDLTDEIYYYKTGAWSGKNTNIDASHKYGIELFDKYLINKNLFTSLNYSYIVAKINTENEANGAYNNKNLPGVSKHNATINIGTNFGHFASLLSHTYRSEAYAGEDLANTFTQKQETYNSTDVSLEYKATKNIEIFGKIQNLFDNKNGLWIKDDLIYPVNYYRNYYAGVKVNF
jgi:iron complex outermembrane receptor protein